ncbi:MAG: DUF1501 domain-containing protein [Sedimentisphaerales bacterium]|nr:DUF1501 domain-containing protein [Sedimentisphaerales bacterium]
MSKNKTIIKTGITNGISRRDALKLGLAGAAGLSFIDGYSMIAGAVKGQLPVTEKKKQAKSVIQIWMWGGPSHLDTFDPKPNAGYDYCGPFDKDIETNVAGIRINAQLPLLAKQADKYSIIRSMTHGINAHETASYLVQTGHEPGRLVYPSIGAVVSLFKGYEHGYQGLVPPYIVLTQPQGRFSEAGFLEQQYRPFATGGDPNKNPFVVEGIVAEGISDERQLSRRNLLHSLDTLGKAIPKNPNFENLDRCEENAYGLMYGDAKRLFDLSEEKEEIRNAYGRNTFGQSCLMARRLVQHGVPYITINYKGWDTHKQHFQIMNRKLPEMDKAMAMLLQDLSDRGLLESTIVWWGGEFGRSPKVQWDPPWNGGRSHFGQCFCTVVAGGGFKGGQVVGASNENGTDVAQRPVYPADLLGSLYELLGIDPDAALPNNRGLDVKVMPPSAQGEGRLKELM